MTLSKTNEIPTRTELIKWFWINGSLAETLILLNSQFICIGGCLSIGTDELVHKSTGNKSKLPLWIYNYYSITIKVKLGIVLG